MTTTSHSHGAATAVPQFALAGSFLEGLAAQDFAGLGGALGAGARLRALLPRGLREWTGAEVIAGQFACWFGDTEDFELAEATVGEVGVTIRSTPSNASLKSSAIFVRTRCARP